MTFKNIAKPYKPSLKPLLNSNSESNRCVSLWPSFHQDITPFVTPCHLLVGCPGASAMYKCHMVPWGRKCEHGQACRQGIQTLMKKTNKLRDKCAAVWYRLSWKNTRGTVEGSQRREMTTDRHESIWTQADLRFLETLLSCSSIWFFFPSCLWNTKIYHHCVLCMLWYWTAYPLSPVDALYQTAQELVELLLHEKCVLSFQKDDFILIICLCVGMCAWAWAPVEARRRCQIRWSWSDKWF